MIVREISAKGILSRSRIYDYVVNPYVGCQHACSYCYARFMQRFTGHSESWGKFLHIKINAAELLKTEIKHKKKAGVWVSGVCDPYQPLEAKYRLTRKCLEILTGEGWPLTIQTRSSLVLRDIDLLKSSREVEVCLSITTADDDIRKKFEASAPAIQDRIKALAELHQAGIKTSVMIAPLLPVAEGLPSILKGKVDKVIIDKMNYHYGDWVYKKYNLEKMMSQAYFWQQSAQIASQLRSNNIDCRVLP
jgi:DNA repair photolyase